VDTTVSDCGMNVHFSSKKHDWETPWGLFNALDAEFNFTVDVCAEEHNAKLAHFFSPEDDGLSVDWGNHICWMNPPYGRDNQMGKKSLGRIAKGSNGGLPVAGPNRYTVVSQLRFGQSGNPFYQRETKV